MADAQPLGVITDYDSLISTLRARADGLGISLRSLDEAAGLHESYSAKILAGHRGLGRVSMGPMLGALGLRLLAVADDDALAKIRGLLAPRGYQGPRLLKRPDRAERARQDKALARSLRRLVKQRLKAKASAA
jgi:hypothetical protein